MAYLDASVVVAMFVLEAHSRRVLDTLAAGGETPSISAWTFTEVASALSLKQRTGQIGADDRRKAAASFAQFAHGSVDVLDVLPMDFHAAVTLIEMAGSSLRSGDALHLAIARRHGLSVLSLDRRMVESASALGLSAAIV